MLHSVQYLRAVAALAVVALHTNWSHTQLGHLGVDMFFVISGFIMVHVSRREADPSVFFRARLQRIVPLYWLATLLWLLVDPDTLERALLSLAFIPSRDSVGDIHPALGVGWTLQYEMLFYLAFAGCLALPARIRLPVLTATFLGTSVAHLSLRPENAIISAWTNPIALEFVAGAWLCRFRQWGVLPMRYAALALFSAGVVWLGWNVNIQTAFTDYRPLLWGLPACALIAGGLGLEDSRWLPRVPGAVLLGDASYAIYLVHLFTNRGIRGYLTVLPWPAAVGVILVISAVVGIAVHLLIERPLTAWLRGKRRVGGVAAEATV